MAFWPTGLSRFADQMTLVGFVKMMPFAITTNTTARTRKRATDPSVKRIIVGIELSLLVQLGETPGERTTVELS
ncbi:hypothetical protein TorRG33x02_083650 [Trema orientale]|uniref:Uncharacterized protein n=1 Tax=Trema orientale TaxID=63057 RepID=A0A2P5FDH4_TREOI|nr:hypothetical protein TorRG33x02_083650 [Trema orientale]